MNPKETTFLESLQPRLSKSDAIKALKSSALANLDTEARHVMADHILLRVINDDELSLAFHRLGKWYA